MSEQRWITPETQQPSRPSLGRRLGQAFVVLALILPVLYGAVAVLAPAPAVAASATNVALPQLPDPVLDWPTTVQASGFTVVGLPGATGTDGVDTPLPMASLTKLITVLVVLEQHPLDGGDGATITLDDSDVAGMQRAFDDAATYFPARPGATVTERQLVEWSMVFSAANAASSLAEWAFGSEAAYVEAANAWVASQGLGNTIVVDSTGLDAAGTSTAADLLRIGELAMAQPDIADAMGLSSVSVPGLGMKENTNALLGTNGIDAGKTGSLFVSGRNLIVSGTQDINGVSYRAVVVVLGAVTYDDVIAATAQLYDSIWANIVDVELVPAGTPVATFDAPWDATVQAVSTDPISATGWPGVDAAVEASLDEATVTVQPVSVGQVSVSVGTSELTTDVQLASPLPQPELGWRLTHPVEVVSWMIAAIPGF